MDFLEFGRFMVDILKLEETEFCGIGMGVILCESKMSLDVGRTISLFLQKGVNDLYIPNGFHHILFIIFGFLLNHIPSK